MPQGLFAKLGIALIDIKCVGKWLILMELRDNPLSEQVVVALKRAITGRDQIHILLGLHHRICEANQPPLLQMITDQMVPA